MEHEEQAVREARSAGLLRSAAAAPREPGYADLVEATLGEDVRAATPGGAVELGERLLRKQTLEQYFEMALAGTLPRLRALRAGEVQKLHPVHLQIVMMKACGVPRKRIAQELDVTEATVTNVTKHPDAQFLLSKILSYAADEVINVETRMEAMLPEALDILAVAMREGTTETRVKVAFGLLDRRGYGKVETTRIVNEVKVERDKADLLNTALREVREIEDVEYVVYDTRDESREAGSAGNAPSGTKVAPAQPGGAVEPPNSHSPAPPGAEPQRRTA
jgi:hypothetical protein